MFKFISDELYMSRIIATDILCGISHIHGDIAFKVYQNPLYHGLKSIYNVFCLVLISCRQLALNIVNNFNGIIISSSDIY